MGDEKISCRFDDSIILLHPPVEHCWVTATKVMNPFFLLKNPCLFFSKVFFFDEN